MRSKARRAAGHPVDVASGVQFTAAHDVEIQGSLSLVWRRYYSTALLTRPPSVVGLGWTHFFEMILSPTPHGWTLFGHDGMDVEFERDASGEPMLNPGAFMELRSAGEGMLLYHWHEDWIEPVKRYRFARLGDGRMRLESVELPSGHALRLHYEGERLAEIVQGVEGRRLLLRHDSRGWLSELLLEAPGRAPRRVASYEHDDTGRLVRVLDASGVAQSYGYDSEGRLVEEVGRSGGRFRMSYDADGRCIETAGEGGWLARRLRFDPVGRETVVTDGLGRTTTYHYNESGQVTAEIAPSGAIERTELDEHGRIVAILGPSGEVLGYGYGPRGDVSEIRYPNGSVCRIEHDDEHQPVAITEASGGRWSFAYERGAVVRVTDPIGTVTEIRRDEQNRICGFRSSAGNDVHVARDASFREEVYSDRFGILARYELDDRVNVAAVHDAAGLVRRFEHDERGYLEAIVESDGTRQQVGCDADGRLVAITHQNGRALRIERDAFGQHRRVIYADGATYEYQWDSEGFLVEIRNPHGEEARYTYDVSGNLVETRCFDGRSERFAYDLSNRLIRREKSDGAVLRFEYDAAGNAIRVLGASGPLATNEFDAFDRLLSTTTADARVAFEYDLLGRPTAETLNDARVEYEYHAFGCIARRSFSASSVGPCTFDYDERRRLRSVSDPTGSVLRYEYDTANQLVTRELGSALEHFRYDARRRVCEQRVVRNGRDLISRAFEHDSEDWLLAVADSRTGSTRYRYDLAARLLASERTEHGERTYAYDACGNLVRSGEIDLQYSSGNRLERHGAAHYRHDANGRLVETRFGSRITRYEWNDLDRLVAVVHPDGERTSFAYDGLGRRVSKRHAGETTKFYWSRDDLLAVETERGLTEYLIHSGVPALLWRDGQLRYSIHSRDLRPRELLDAAGESRWTGDFDDWGRPRDDAHDENPLLGSPGQYWDRESGLYYNRFRYYSPEDARFLSPDPIGLRGGLNEYRYAPNLIGWVDPLGLACGQPHFHVTINPAVIGGASQAEWIKKRNAYNAGVQNGINTGTPMQIPTPAQYTLDRRVGNNEARNARTAQGMGGGVQADHPVDLSCGGGQGQPLYPLASGVNTSVGSQLGPQASALGPGNPTPMFDLYDQAGNLIP